MMHSTCDVNTYKSMDITVSYTPAYHTHTYIHTYIHHGGARGVVVIVVGNGHGDTSSNPGRDWLHFT